MTSDDIQQRAQTVPQELVDALQYAFGNAPARGLFAKGLLLEGTFAPTRNARRLCSAKLFVHDKAQVLARFSNFAGAPAVGDATALARPHGLALKLSVPHEPELDVVAHSFNGFPARTAHEFRDLLIAMGLSPPQTPSPTALERYLDSHPAAREFFAGQTPPPASYATLLYYGVNAFKVTNACGEERSVRYRFVPRAGERFLTTKAATKRSLSYLSAELRKRLRAGPILFDWLVQIAEPGDVLDDPSRPWPSGRELQSLGTVSLTRYAEN